MLESWSPRRWVKTDRLRGLAWLWFVGLKVWIEWSCSFRIHDLRRDHTQIRPSRHHLRRPWYLLLF